MKKLTLLSLLLFSLSFCFAKEAEKLPEIPWRAIVEMQNQPLLPRMWKTDISVKLFGKYSETDSLMVDNAISELNKLSETIHFRLSSLNDVNLKLFFLDSTNRLAYNPVIGLKSNEKSNYSSSSADNNSWLNVQAINMNLIPEESKQNFLTNTLAFVLYPNYWMDRKYDFTKQYDKKDESIFLAWNPGDRDELFMTEMSEFDKKLLKEVYAVNFEKNLKRAQKQFGKSIPRWLAINPYSFLLLPFLLLLLLVLVVYIKISKRTIQRIQNKLLRFNINGLVLGVFFALIISFYLSLSLDIKHSLLSFSQLPRNTIFGAIYIFAIGLPAINLLRFFEIIIHKNAHGNLLRSALIFLTTGLIPFSAGFAFFYFITNRRWSEGEIQIISYILLACLVLAAFRALISYFIFKEKDLILENETKLSNLRELKSRAELNALHSRINPHFLYNSLNSIAGLAHEDADKTEHMALSLSKLFRYSINKDQSDWTTFKEEMEMVRIYLEVEKVRFDDRLSYSVELPRELEDYKIPRFMIQPLVENAVKHGISKSVKSGQIKVAVTQEGKKLFISVSDDGPAFPNDLAPGFGIQSIYDKLEILYKDKFEMNFINSPQKQVLIKLN